MHKIRKPTTISTTKCRNLRFTIFVSASLMNCNVLNKQVSSTVQYGYSEFDNKSIDKQFDTHRVEGRLNYYDRSGFFAFARASWFQQRFEDILTQTDTQNILMIDNVRDFWLTDIGLGYELDEQAGSVQIVFKNIFDRDFDYEEQRGDPMILPNFSVFLRGSYNF